jgi:hypothetical protein
MTAAQGDVSPCAAFLFARLFVLAIAAAIAMAGH